MSFTDDVNRFKGKVDARLKALHDGVVLTAFASIKEGSPITGAPGQLVDTGDLKSSWINTIESPLTNLIATKLIYAEQMETGTRAGRALIQRSPTGGFHSVALTRAAWPRIVAYVTERLTRA